MTRRLPQVAKDAGKALRSLHRLRKTVRQLQVMSPDLHDSWMTEAGITSERFDEMMDHLENQLKDVRARESAHGGHREKTQ